MRNYSDPTADAAIKAVDREFKAKEKLAKRLKELRKKGLLSDEKLIEVSAQFPGIFRNLYGEIFKE